MEENEQYDYAVLKLSDKVPLKKYFSLKVCENSEGRNKKVTIQGYEMLRTDGEQVATLNQYYHSERIEQVNPGSLYYHVDTKKQQSGSPVMLYNTNKEIEVVGIHKGYHKRMDCNMGVRVTDEMVNLIK